MKDTIILSQSYVRRVGRAFEPRSLKSALFVLLSALPAAFGCGSGSDGVSASGDLPTLSPVLLAVPAATADPGVRGGAPGAGAAYAGLSADEQALFAAVKDVFEEIDSVSGTVPEEDGKGLGPTFNSNSCASCHKQPDVGGSSPAINPQIAAATLQGAVNVIPPFLLDATGGAHSPVREARFPSDGGVHGLFTIQGRTDAPGCTTPQPDFATALANNNLVFRIPTPLFGLGLVENTPDSVLQANLSADADRKQTLGISGSFNTSGNDGTITRFGWKAQNKSLLLFAGEAYNVEQGVSNEAFGNERSVATGCAFNPGPEDGTKSDLYATGNTAADLSGDIISFALFMRLAAAPTPTVALDSAGATVFNTVGCNLCHSATLTSGISRYTAMGNATYHPFSDFALHHMGAGLADGISQGGAGPDQFRTAPLWGVGQRIFFLHDGRSGNLVDAIEAHASAGSEANAVIQAFNTLSSADQALLLTFLRGL